MRPTHWIARTLVLCVTLALAGCDRDEPVGLPVPPPSDKTAPASTGPSNPMTRIAPVPRVSLLDMTEDPTAHDIKGRTEPDRLLPKLIQTLAVFDHPKSCTPSLDGQFLFVTNTGFTEDGYRQGKGFISKLAIQPDGRLKVVNLHFLDGLSAPMGITCLTRATRKFPAGSLLVSIGTTNQIDAEGNQIEDIKTCNPGIAILDPNNARVLGFIPMGKDSGVSRRLNRVITTPNGIAVDHEGNVFVAETGSTGKYLKPSIAPIPGILKFKNESLDTYAENQVLERIEFISVRHEPNSIYYSPLDDGIYWTTCSGQGDAGGSLWRIKRRDFTVNNESTVSNLAGGLGTTLEGLTITPMRGRVDDKQRWGGTLIFARTDGQLMYMNQQRVVEMALFGEDEPTFGMPSDLKLHILPNQTVVLYIPERDEVSDKPNKQKLRVLLLPLMM